MLASVAASRADDRLIGTWSRDDGFQVVAYTFRSDGRYQLDTRSTDPDFGYTFSDRGRYQADAGYLEFHPYDYVGDPPLDRNEFLIEGDLLTVTSPEFSVTQVYHYQPGSREDVLDREKAAHDLVGTWRRPIPNAGIDEFTFRPGGYYFQRRLPEDPQFPIEIIRGRYTFDGSALVIRPYSGVEDPRVTDFFGSSLTLIREESLSGQAQAYDLVPGSREEVRTKAAEGAAFLERTNWQVGTWEVRDPFLIVDVTFRPDGHFIAAHGTEGLAGTVRGRYSLEARRIQLAAFPGQDPYARSNGEFGKGDRTREVDFYDGELQFINLEALSQSVWVARKRPGSEAPVLEKTRQAQAQRAREGWHFGSWEVRDPLGWMRFTFRPDQRYIATAGSGETPGQVERGQYSLATEKLTLAPYLGSGAARGFEWDLYDDELFLIGDNSRMVVAKKVPGSESEVISKTLHPTAMQGERGSILGRWSAPIPGQSVEVTFRDDGQFRLSRCSQGTVSTDYGLFRADMATRTLVWDSRFTPAQTLGLDFYGDTLTIHGGPGGPSTYRVNLGTVDAAIAASHTADQEEAQVDAEWLARVPIGPRDPAWVQGPVGNLPADPNPSRVFDSPTVLTHYHLYRRLIPGFVYFNVLGTIRSVAIVNTREWHFFPSGRVLVRFRNYYAAPIFPTTLEEISDSWGAYRVTEKPTESDIQHLFADNLVHLDMDSGDRVEMTLEDGRRHLFWDKDYQILSEWAAVQKPIPCEAPAETDATLANTGLSLSSGIAPDEIPVPQPVLLGISMSATGGLILRGTTDQGGTVVIDHTPSLGASTQWQPLQTNQIAAGAFTVSVPRGNSPSTYFRVRRP